MTLTFKDIYDWIDACAPFDTQAGFDNSGLLIGSWAEPVRGIHTALDVTSRVLDEAEARGANLLVTHHPVMFSPIQSLVEDRDPESALIMRMIRSRIGLIAAHTNLDQARGGINDTLAARLGLTEVTGEGYLRVGTLPRALTLDALCAHTAAALNTTVRVMGHFPPDRLFSRLAVASGAGSEFWSEARAMGAQALVSGEIRHHHALAMTACGMAGLEAGHFATEEPGIFALADALQHHLIDVQCGLTVSKTATGAYAPPAAD